MRSPWLIRLPKRTCKRLRHDISTDVLIVGAGIAGVLSAYYVLKDTKHRVLLIDKGKIAHGATGHNAGQIVSYFESGYRNLERKYGAELAADAQRSIVSAWDLLDRAVADLDVTPPLSFAGFAGIADMQQLMEHLEDRRLQTNAKLDIEHLYVHNDDALLRMIPEQYDGLYSVIDRAQLAKKLQTKDERYIAALSGRKGCMNSARLCYEVVRALEKKYADRFCIFEDSAVTCIEHVQGVVIAHGSASIHASHVVLCTNGFPAIPVQGSASPDGLTYGIVGYMRAHTAALQPPSAVSYLQPNTDAYFYVTRRPHGRRALVCVGGPELRLIGKYSASGHYVPHGRSATTDFLSRAFGRAPKPLYEWEGLMGYTKTGLRCIGAHPAHPWLLYNLGCNGTGILPSVFGAKRVALLLSGKHFPPTVFDPHWHLA